MLRLHKHRKHRAPQRPVASTSATSREDRQSFLGTLSLTGALFGLLLLALQGMVKLMVGPKASVFIHQLVYWLALSEIGIAGLAFFLALFSFIFSARRHGNAVLGLLLSLAVVAGWVVFGNYSVR